jgi:hypothetical protein
MRSGTEHRMTTVHDGRMQAGGEPWDVGLGERIVLANNLWERITAVEETAFLLTVA